MGPTDYDMTRDHVSSDIRTGPDRRPGRIDWDIAVYCRDEQNVVGSCLDAIIQQADPARSALTLILNGCTDASGDRAIAVLAHCRVPATVYSIAYPDKSNAINRFFYQWRHDASLYFGVDAHTTIAPQALANLAAGLDQQPQALAATGISENGRTMRAATEIGLRQGGQLNGPLYAVRASFVERMVAQGVRLPIGLYRGDGLLGSMLAHDLDALAEPFVRSRILSVGTSAFSIRQLSPFRLSDLIRQFRRKIRQMRGILENQAIKDVIYRSGYTALPQYADDMIRAYVAAHGLPRVPLFDRPFLAIALAVLARHGDRTEDELQGRLIFENDAARRIRGE